MATRKPAAAPAGGARKPRDKGTRGGRPEPQLGQPGKRPGGNGSARTRTRPADDRRQVRTARVPQPEAETAAAETGRGTPPLWLQIVTWVLAAGGLGVSVYLTIAHFNQHVTLACPASSHINCEKVTTSPESYVFGIPVAVLGLAFFVFMIAAVSPWAWRAKWAPIGWARLGSVIVGMAFVLYLVYTELFTLNLTICLWCTSVHVITFALFGLILFAATATFETAAAKTSRRR
jgi:uncharacterized membrane protein